MTFSIPMNTDHIGKGACWGYSKRDAIGALVFQRPASGVSIISGRYTQ